MTDGEDDDGVDGFEILIERHVTRAATREDEFAQPFLNGPADERVLLQGPHAANDQ